MFWRYRERQWRAYMQSRQTNGALPRGSQVRTFLASAKRSVGRGCLANAAFVAERRLLQFTQVQRADGRSGRVVDDPRRARRSRAAVRNRCHRLAGFTEMKPPRLAAHEWSAWSSRACRRSGGPLAEGRGLALHGTRYFDLDYRRAGSDYLDRQLRATGLEDHQERETKDISTGMYSLTVAGFALWLGSGR